MWILHLVFVLHSGTDTPTFQDRHLQFPTQAACEAARLHWNADYSAQLPDMRPEWDLLLPGDCTSADPLIS